MRRLLKKYTRKIVFLPAVTALCYTGSIGQTAQEYRRLLKMPKQYTILSTTEKIWVDGKCNEKDWTRAPWTEDFTDITTGAVAEESKKARCKMLWDSAFLYVYAEFREQDIWASLTKHDEPVFQDNALEIFINPDGSTFNYFEFQINANETVWDLFMPRPYRSGGIGLSSWDIRGLQKSVHIAGTLNNPADRDTAWSIELAIPFASLDIRKPPVKTGTIWRMNFSRVQWQLDTVEGKYQRRRDTATNRPCPEHYMVWSPQGIVNLHFPERWGYVRFADTLSPRGFLSQEDENIKLALWKYYYLQQEYRRNNGKYAASIDQLDLIAAGLSFGKNAGIRMLTNEKQFRLEGKLVSSNEYISIDQEGEVRTERIAIDRL